MKGIVIDLKDISDSREVMESKESPKIRCFIYIMFAVLVTFVLFACFLKIDEYSRVTGEIRTVEALSSVITTNNCKIEKILVDEGQKVNQGDILYVLDSDYYQEQKKIIEDKLVKYNADLENTKLLKQSIEQDVNLFKNNESDSNYYYRFSQYKNGVLLTAKEFEQSNFSNSLTNEDNTKNLVAVNNSIKEKQSEKSSYQNMLNAVLSNYTYSGNNSTVNSIYDEYISNLQKSEMIYEEYIKQFSYLSKMIDEQSDMELITSEQLQTARSEYENTYSLMEKYTSSYITEIKMKIVVLENQLVEEDNKT